MFTREAVALIHERSQGIPRTISVIADNALVGGLAAGQRPVGSELVREICRDFDLREAAVKGMPPPQPGKDGRPSAESSATEVPAAIRLARSGGTASLYPAGVRAGGQARGAKHVYRVIREAQVTFILSELRSHTMGRLTEALRRAADTAGSEPPDARPRTRRLA